MPTDTRVRKEAIALAQQGILVFVLCFSASTLDRLHKNIHLIPLKIDSDTRGGGSPLSLSSLTSFWVHILKHRSLLNLSKTPIIHAHDSTTLVPGLLLKIYRPSSKFIYDSHESAIDSIGENFGLLFTIITYVIELVSFRLISTIITVSPMQKYVLETRYGSFVPKIRLVRNLPAREELERYSLQHGKDYLRQQDISIEDRLVLIYATYIGVNRGIPELINAWKMIDRDDVVFLLAGDGPLRELVDDELPNLKNFHYLGYVDAETYYAVMKACDLGLSLIDTESNLNKKIGYPNKMTEYLACGLVPLSTRLQNFAPEFNAGSAIAIEQLTSSAIAKSIDDLDYQSIKHIRANNRETINSRYLWENDLNTLFTEYYLDRQY